MATFTPITLNADALSLLTAAGLPVADLEDGMSRVFVGGYEEDELVGVVGVVGVELHLPAGLLRSLAVAQSHQALGTGAALVGLAERLAADAGVAELFLLTATAAPLFERRGYRHVARIEAPESIRRSRQFAGICPDTAAFMVKRL
ncbi:GNAT family N-acetyltransferase|uniref:arsenic resistance N-acetyltransferase ArsN2 n=1 Tax=Stenotrophomonas sp. SbOxS2 TaxID=2723885 RepID=UPI0015D297CA|nr:arsenic resistance N-acetyltransferase ArsN2 [Stenotrophomonas sp. SbOxS2]NYT99439.1 GNAT family N-acetyltransferase [Stenotrophomonas sp. SbOxS2]